MPKCYVCSNDFTSIRALVLHLRTFHDIQKKNSLLRCVENSCMTEFNNVYVFTRHLRNQHYCNAVGIPIVRQNTSEDGLASTVSDNSITCNHDGCYDATDPYSSQIEKSNNENQSVEVPVEINFRSFTNLLETTTVSFISGLYMIRLLPRIVIQKIVDSITLLLSRTFSIALEEKICNHLRNLGDLDSNIHNISSAFNSIRDPFKNISTEYLRFKYFTNLQYFIRPEDVIVGQTLQDKVVNGGVQVQTCNAMMKFVSLRKVLKLFFELPNVFQATVDYMNSLSGDSEIISNYIQGDAWRAKVKSYGEKLVPPLFLYFDEYEVNNPLGSRAGLKKLGAVYCTIPCLPPQFQSKVENIFLVLLFYARDRIKYGNMAIFRKVIDELNFLQSEGILIRTLTGMRRVYFVFSSIIGDNLGLHSVLGFVESFSANRPCRFCDVTKPNLSTKSFNEDSVNLRTLETYNVDIESINVYESGIKEECVWNLVKNFHALHNNIVDIMHDALEGICRFDMSLILKHLILDLKLFSLETLNFRIKCLNYGPIERRNKPPQIKNLNSIKMSASEMLCFVRHLSFAIGDFVSTENPYWYLYLKLRQLLDVITAPSLHKECAGSLKTLVQEHNELYSQLSNKNLKPKHHHMIHYPTIFKLAGPLVHLWSMRFESKHRDGKTTASMTTSRRNIIHTIAIREQVQLCQRFLTNEGFLEHVEIGPSITLPIEVNISQVPLSFRENSLATKWISIQGIVYKPHLALIIDLEPTVAVICRIIVNKDQRVCFMFQKYVTISYDEHMHAYEVEKQNELVLIVFEELPNHMPVSIVPTSNGKSYFAPRSAL